METREVRTCGQKHANASGSQSITLRENESRSGGETGMTNKTCKSCIDNDNGLCDRKGIMIHEDDTCDKHKEDWRQRMMDHFQKIE